MFLRLCDYKTDFKNRDDNLLLNKVICGTVNKLRIKKKKKGQHQTHIWQSTSLGYRRPHHTIPCHSCVAENKSRDPL